MASAVAFAPSGPSALAAAAFVDSSSASDCPPALTGGKTVDFDNFPEGSIVGNAYAKMGVRFGDTFEDTPRIATGRPTGTGTGYLQMSFDRGPSHSYNFGEISMTFDTAQSFVGMYASGGRWGENQSIDRVRLHVYNGKGVELYQRDVAASPDPVNFVGVRASSPIIAKIRLTGSSAGDTNRIDGLCFGSSPFTTGSGPYYNPVAVHTMTRLRPMPATLPAGTDLSIQGMEFTQAIQTYADPKYRQSSSSDNSDVLVAGRPTIGRIYGLVPLGVEAQNNIPYRVHIAAGGKSYALDVRGPAGAPTEYDPYRSLYTPSNSVLEDLAFSANVGIRFNAPLTATVYVEVDPDNKISEPNESNNRWPASGTKSITFQASRKLTVLGQRIHGTSDYWGDLTVPKFEACCAGPAFQQLAPIGDTNVDYRLASGELNYIRCECYPDPADILAAQLSYAYTSGLAVDAMTGVPAAYLNADTFYGWADPRLFYDSSNVAPYADPPSTGGGGLISFGPSSRRCSGEPQQCSGYYPAESFVQGLMQNFDLKAIPKDDCHYDECFDTDWPNPYSHSIGEWGVDPLTGTVLWPVTGPYSDYYRANYPDARSDILYMGIEEDKWISPFHWDQLWTKMNHPTLPFTPTRNFVPAVPVASEQLIVHATIHSDDTAIFGTMQRLPDGQYFDPFHDATGAYAIEQRNGSTVLSSEPIRILFLDQHGIAKPSRTVDLSIPFNPAATSIAITKGSTTLAERPVSPGAPVVSIAPQPASYASDDIATIAWTASDADGGPLTADVLYTTDNSEWTTLAAGITSGSISVPVDTLAGSHGALFRVMVSDGVNTTIADSNPVDIPDQAPMVNIVSPAPSARFGSGNEINFEAAGTDLEDGSLTDTAYEWFEGSTILGTGRVLSIDTMNPGKHFIRVRAYDSAGNIGTSSTLIMYVVATSTPALTIASPEVFQNTSASATFTVSTIDAHLTCTVNYGDGTGEWDGTISGQTCIGPDHAYGAIGTYPVTVSIWEEHKDLGFGATNVTVVDSSPPQVAFTRGEGTGIYVADQYVAIPTASHRIMIGATTIEASADDAESGISTLSFAVDGFAVASSYNPTTKRYSFTFRSPSIGTHRITATAVNGASGSATASIDVLGIPVV